jgi:uncharacterized membrane protein
MNDWTQYPKERAPQIGLTERMISAIGGGVLLGYGLTGSSKMRIPMLLVAAALLGRGLSGYSPIYRFLNITRSSRRIHKGVSVEQAVLINQPVEEVFAFWMALENLPHFMNHLEQVSVRDDGTSHWVAKAPLGIKAEWDARITALQPGSLIAWQSLPGATIANAGEVRFKPGPGGDDTEIHVILEYKAPGGSAGAALARLLGEEPEVQVREDLLRLKALLETGDVSPLEDQPSGRNSL